MEGEVVSFTSHGAMVDVPLPAGGVLHCYIPLTAMGTPAPTKARQVLKKGEVRPFLLAGLDPPRRVAELALPEAVAGAPSDQVSEGGAAAPVGEGPVGKRPIGAKRVVETPSVERPARPRKDVAEAAKSTTVKRTRGASEKAALLEKAATPKRSASMKKASAKATAPDTDALPTKKKAGAKTSSTAKNPGQEGGRTNGSGQEGDRRTGCRQEITAIVNRQNPRQEGGGAIDTCQEGDRTIDTGQEGGGAIDPGQEGDRPTGRDQEITGDRQPPRPPPRRRWNDRPRRRRRPRKRSAMLSSLR